MECVQLLTEFQDIFAKNNFGLGFLNGPIRHEKQTEGPKTAKKTKVKNTIHALKFEKKEYEHIQ